MFCKRTILRSEIGLKKQKIDEKNNFNVVLHDENDQIRVRSDFSPIQFITSYFDKNNVSLMNITNNSVDKMNNLIQNQTQPTEVFHNNTIDDKSTIIDQSNENSLSSTPKRKRNVFELLSLLSTPPSNLPLSNPVTATDLPLTSLSTTVSPSPRVKRSIFDLKKFVDSNETNIQINNNYIGGKDSHNESMMNNMSNEQDKYGTDSTQSKGDLFNNNTEKIIVNEKVIENKNWKTEIEVRAIDLDEFDIDNDHKSGDEKIGTFNWTPKKKTTCTKQTSSTHPISSKIEDKSANLGVKTEFVENMTINNVNQSVVYNDVNQDDGWFVNKKAINLLNKEELNSTINDCNNVDINQNIDEKSDEDDGFREDIQAKQVILPKRSPFKNNRDNFAEMNEQLNQIQQFKFEVKKNRTIGGLDELDQKKKLSNKSYLNEIADQNGKGNVKIKKEKLTVSDDNKSKNTPNRIITKKQEEKLIAQKQLAMKQQLRNIPKDTVDLSLVSIFIQFHHLMNIPLDYTTDYYCTLNDSNDLKIGNQIDIKVKKKSHTEINIISEDRISCCIALVYRYDSTSFYLSPVYSV